jgi:serine/threonine protein kinase
VPTEAQFAPPEDDPLRKVTPSVDDVEARRAKAAIEGRLFSGPARRVKVGRYRVLGRIGAGGMGVVYKAHDPELARDVAVKLMNTDAVADSDAEHARGRLVREARAMARLAHPNVIHVYDVGTVEDGVFIAMELVEGESLGAWVKGETRPWKDVLARFVEAGRGLAAAHDAGVIHRDFKPENVLCGVDGRVRVGDFGLAGGPGSETGRHEPVSASDSGQASIDRSAVSDALTRTGALLGTPKYMAPEQEAGLAATARSDQFSFCVALYEALFGQAPYAGDSVIEYRLEVREGKLRTPPVTDVPGWIAEVLAKGLSIEPADRHASMQMLLDRLAEALVDPVVVEPPVRKRPVVWFSALAGLIVVAVVLGVAVLQGEPPVQPQEVVVFERPATPNPGTAQPATQPTDTSGGKVAPAILAEEEKGEEAAPEPTPEVKTSAKRTSPKSQRGRGAACYFDEDWNPSCYQCAQTNNPRIMPTDGTHCGPRFICTLDRTRADCST